MKKIKLFIKVLVCSIMINSFAYAQNPADYLILQDIGIYKHKVQTKDLITLQPKSLPGYNIWYNPGVLAGANHFSADHRDTNYETDYESTNMAVEVQVTQHTGGDSDRWLLHEIEKGYRSSKDDRLGILIQASRLREINGNKIIGRRGNGYRWVSNKIVVDVSYTDLDGTKPEPLEVVQTYLAKYPSIITVKDDIEFKSNAYNVKWIKDEMERRLWLCDKWNAQFQSGGVAQEDLLGKLFDNMEVFINYRQKYFSVQAQADLDLLAGYQRNNDLASLQTKLSEYKGWWNSNKARAISLP